MTRSDEDAVREGPDELEGDVATAPADGADPAARIAELEAELEQARHSHARAVADYQNLRRRSNEERAEQARLTMKTLVLNYLPVLDDLNRALDSVGDHEELSDHPWVEGVRMVQRKFSAILEAAGAVEVLVSQGNDHTMGGSRMGADPATSVVDRDLKAHDHPNLYVCDASVFVTSGGAQPSQTIMALATRLADHLVAGAAPSSA